MNLLTFNENRSDDDDYNIAVCHRDSDPQLHQTVPTATCDHVMVCSPRTCIYVHCYCRCCSVGARHHLYGCL